MYRRLKFGRTRVWSAWQLLRVPIFNGAFRPLEEGWPDIPKPGCSEDCFQGSTEFYDSAYSDEFTPSYLVAQPLSDSIGRRRDGTLPPWMKNADPNRYSSPAQCYVEWFNGIWHTGDPSSWDATVFTSDAVMIDPTGISRGAQQAADNFVRLFQFYPELRGEVVSWAANDREIFINWRFKIIRKGNKAPLLVAVVDKFCFVDGLVSFRLAYFDLISFAGYLSENFGGDHLLDYLRLAMRAALETGGIQSLPRTIWSFLQGIFLWLPSPPKSNLRVRAGDGHCLLEWPAVENAAYYRVCRATSFSGPYTSLSDKIVPSRHDASPIRYVDRNVENGTAYWYTVTPYFTEWEPVPVRKSGRRYKAHESFFLQQR